MAKQKYYRLEHLNDSVPADYHILLGERSNGKSYAVKERALIRAWKNPDENKFMLMRRWGMELKASYVEQYFTDAPITAITGGQCNTVVANAGKIYLAKYNEETRKNERVAVVGYYRDLMGEQHFVSQNFNDTDLIIFEEFISRDYYLPDECNKLQNFVSTVARRRHIDVYMIGNTISRVCPYFNDWGLVNIPKQKQGTIDTYKVKTDQVDEITGEPVIITITVEYCENSGNNSKMFFGAKSGMITGGAWQVSARPHLQGRLSDYTIMHEIIFVCKSFKFRMFFLQPKNGGLPIWYVEPYNFNIYNDVKFKNKRFVVDKFESGLNINSDLITVGFTPFNDQEKTAFCYFERMCFSDNLTGSDYDACIKVLTK